MLKCWWEGALSAARSSLCRWRTQGDCSVCQGRFLPKQGASLAISRAFWHEVWELSIRI